MVHYTHQLKANALLTFKANFLDHDLQCMVSAFTEVEHVFDTDSI